ncbi:CoF synthetase [Loktanella agnita]|uniref:CoF synthetase n=1 Tax=Loktanella agnita TaxID=287097 RepID=UPI003989FE3F
MTGAQAVFETRHALIAYWRARRIRSRAQLEAVQQKRLSRWLRNVVPNVPFYRDFAGAKLADLPIVDKATLMVDFARFNTAGITNEQGWAAFEGDKTVGDYIVGASTGTSGNRGLFVISQAERFRWLGTILAKALPGFWRETHRVAILLPLNTPLYDSANRLRRLSLRFFDVGGEWQEGLAAFNPTVIVAPPKILRMMADAGMALRPHRVFAGAETLDPLDRVVIEAYFGLTLGQIYMGTEGLFAVSCEKGALHLCEDTMHFELPVVADDRELREVIISDFSRDVQVMARYRMNDLVRLGPPCSCGLPQRVLAEVVGRADDCFDLPGGMLTPDLLRNAVVDADRSITDFRVIQTGAAEVVVIVPPGADTAAVQLAFAALFARKGVTAALTVHFDDLVPEMSRKLRRVENRYGRG